MFVANDDDRRRPGPLAEPDLHLRQGGRRDHGLRHRSRPAGSSIRPTSASARISARSIRCSSWRCPKPTSRRRTMNGMVLLTGTVASPGRRRGGRAPRPGLRRRGHAGDQPAADRDAAAGEAAGADRRGQPLAVTRTIGVNLLSRDHTGGFQFGIGQGASPGTITDVGLRPLIDPATGLPQVVGTNSSSRTRRRHRARRSASPAGCSASTCCRRARPGREQRPGRRRSPSRPDRAFGRDRQLPGRRRVPDPDLAVARHGHDRVQAIRRQPRLHPDRAGERPHLDARPAGSVGAFDRGRDPLQRLRRPGADHAARRDDGRARLRPELHDRRPAAQRRTTTRSTRRPASATCRSSARCSARTASAATRPSW